MTLSLFNYLDFRKYFKEHMPLRLLKLLWLPNFLSPLGNRKLISFDFQGLMGSNLHSDQKALHSLNTFKRQTTLFRCLYSDVRPWIPRKRLKVNGNKPQEKLKTGMSINMAVKDALKWKNGKQKQIKQ